jgi:hypothetical protein
MRDPQNLNKMIPRAAELLRKWRHLTDEDILQKLIEQGIQPNTALRLVEFLPMAYARLILQPSGARFPDTFRRVSCDGTLQEFYLGDEPVWNAALAFAQSEIARGASASELLTLAGRSAEFQAANDLLNRGSEIKNIVFTPPVLTWKVDEQEAN